MIADVTENVSLGRLLALTARRWRQILDMQLQPYDLTDATWQALFELHRYGRPLHPKEIAEALLLDKSSMVRVSRTLEAKGLISKTPDDSDGRAFYLSITQEGKDRLREVNRLSRQIEAEAIAAIPAEDLAVTRRVIEQIYNAISQRE